VTASIPKYVAADSAGNKEWIVDVYIGPMITADTISNVNVIKDVPIVPAARQKITDIRLPVLMERSKQGKYTVIGRSKELPAGTQLPDGSIFEPTYHEVKHNFSDLRLLYIADLDFELEPLQLNPATPLQAVPAEPLQTVKGFDAFGKQAFGPGTEIETPLYGPVPVSTTTTRHIKITGAKLGPKGDPLAMDWGTSELQPFFQQVIELTI
jgi:hypothetical protein